MAKGWLDNYNNSKVSAPEGFQGDGYSNVGRNYSPAWKGQFQKGGKLTFLQPTDENLPEGYVIPYDTSSSERAMSIGGENGEPAYLIPTFKHGRPIYNAIEEFKKTGEHLGGPFKNWMDAEQWEKDVRHPAVEKKETIMFPQEKFAMGGSLPGATGHIYARIGAPSNGKYAKHTLASAKNGTWLDNYEAGGVIKDDMGQWAHPGEITEIGSNNITMEGVPYNVLGVSDTGDTKLMKPGKNYKFKGKKVTEFPMAQDGIKTFYNDYINSPKYKERLELQNYNNLNKVVSDRSKHLLNTKLNTIKDIGGFTENNTGSYYTPSINTVDYDEFDLKLYPGATPEDIKTHEFSHAVSALSPKNKSNLTLNKKEVTEINSRNKNKQEHEKEPEEAKADMDVLRYHLKKDKLYDTGKEEFTPELYNTAKKKYKNNQTIKRFFDRFSNKDAIYLMNNIAQLNNEDEYMPMAQNGIRQEQKGLVNLDQLTNFTNYNTKQPGGWLDEY